MRSAKTFFAKNSVSFLFGLSLLAASPHSFSAEAFAATSKNMSVEAAFPLIAREWASMDKSTNATPLPMDRGAMPQWSPKLSPVLPETWPPSSSTRYVYYAYAQYQQLHSHGPLIRQSAPWALLRVSRDQPPTKEILRSTIGPVMAGLDSFAISAEDAQRLIRTREEGEARIASFLQWTRLPDNGDPDARAIRAYYCQWAAENSSWSRQYARPRHAAFFDWLGCPPQNLLEYLRGL